MFLEGVCRVFAYCRAFDSCCARRTLSLQNLKSGLVEAYPIPPPKSSVTCFPCLALEKHKTDPQGFLWQGLPIWDCVIKIHSPRSAESLSPNMRGSAHHRAL